MELVLTEDLFENGRYTVRFGESHEALFIIVDEEFPGNNTIGRLNKITIFMRRLTDTGEPEPAVIQSSVIMQDMPRIGTGNQLVGVRSALPQLRGKIINRDNMADCVVMLYENN